jgi:Big-like domain-containing protein
VTMRFSEPVTGVDRGTLTLTTASGTAVPATVRYDAAGRTATLDPTPTLKAGTRYRVALTTGIRDAAGNRLAATAWTFTTGSR